MKGFVSSIFAVITVLLLALATSSVWTKTTHAQFTTLQAEQNIVDERFLDAKQFFEATAMDSTLNAFKNGQHEGYGCKSAPLEAKIEGNKDYFKASEEKLSDELIKVTIEESKLDALVSTLGTTELGYDASIELKYRFLDSNVVVESRRVKKIGSNMEFTHYLDVNADPDENPSTDDFTVQLRSETGKVFSKITSECSNPFDGS